MNAAIPQTPSVNYCKNSFGSDRLAINPSFSDNTDLGVQNLKFHNGAEVTVVMAQDIRSQWKPFRSDLTISESVERATVEGAASLSALLRQKINELLALESNWDGENAKPVKPHVLADMVETLRRLAQQMHDFVEPFLAPTFDGFVQMEWRENKRSLDIEAVDKGWSAVGTEIGPDGERHYHTAEFGRNDFVRLMNCYNWFSGKELIWPLL
jgi:hypothetical protein